MQDELRQWVAGELVRCGVFNEDETTKAAAACASERRLDDTATVVALARATARTFEGVACWTQERKGYLLAGQPLKAYVMLGRRLAGVEDDDVVPGRLERGGSWTIEMPSGASVGDEFVVGDGINHWARATVVASEGGLEARVDPARAQSPLPSLHTAALTEACTILSST